MGSFRGLAPFVCGGGCRLCGGGASDREGRIFWKLWPGVLCLVWGRGWGIFSGRWGMTARPHWLRPAYCGFAVGLWTYATTCWRERARGGQKGKERPCVHDSGHGWKCEPEDRAAQRRYWRKCWKSGTGVSIKESRADSLLRLLTTSAASKTASRSRLCRAVRRAMFVRFRQAALRLRAFCY